MGGITRRARRGRQDEPLGAGPECESAHGRESEHGESGHGRESEHGDSGRGRESGATAALDHEAHAVERLDRALLGVRKAVTLSEITSMPLPELPGGIDLAKAMACMAIADLTADEPERNVTVKDVAATLTLEHSTTSRLLADTETVGLVERHTDPTDRRRTSVRLTEVGHRSVDQIVATRTWALDALLADWSSEDIAGFASYLERFTATMRERLDDVIAAAITQFVESEPEVP